MEAAVRRGLARRGREVVPYLGVDEKSFQKQQEYVTVLCDLGARRVPDVCNGCDRASLDQSSEGRSEEQIEKPEDPAGSLPFSWSG